jgi:hypothetical protein
MFETVFKMDSIAKLLNDYTFTDYYYRLNLLANSVFEWEGLPNHISEKWIERFLFTEGCCMFFKDPDLGFMVAKCTHADTLNEYDEPTKLLPVATNYIYKGEPLINNKECVLICNNDLKLPTYPTIRLYAYRLAEITRTADVNIHAQKTPCFIRGTDKSVLTLKNVYRQWDGNEPVIFYDKNGVDTPIEVLKTEAPIVFDKLRDEKHQVWNECMTFLGINNANTDKRERLVDDEVQANNEQIQLSAEMMLKARQEACKLINELFGLNVSVKVRQFNTEEIQTLTKEGEEE